MTSPMSGSSRASMMAGPNAVRSICTLRSRAAALLASVSRIISSLGKRTVRRIGLSGQTVVRGLRQVAQIGIDFFVNLAHQTAAALQVARKLVDELSVAPFALGAGGVLRSEEPTSELQSLMRTSYA